jgi:hypothetical protein
MGYLRKFTVCFLSALVIALTLQRIIYRTIWEFGGHAIPPPLFAAAGCALLVLAAIVYSVRWQRKETRGAIDSQQVLAVWQGILAVFIALDLSMFGWQKLFHQQGFTPLARLDEPFNSFSGEALTWAYFGYSYGFTVVVALCQIVGAFLLLFRRTRLFGAIFLLPVLGNIVLLNIFYGFETGDLVHALVLLTGVMYGILQQYHRLAAFVFHREPGNPQFSLAKAGGLAAVTIGFPMLLVRSFGSPDHHPQLTGKYRVQDLALHGTTQPTTIYFDLNDAIVLEFGGIDKRWLGHYQLNEATGALTATWRWPPSATDTLSATLTHGQTGQWRMTGRLGKDSLNAALVKEKAHE